MFYQLSCPEVLRELKSDPVRGLTPHEVAGRRKKYGDNILPSKKPPSLLSKFFNQFKNTLTIILLIATVISFALGDTLDAVSIMVIVLINASIGFFQEISAQHSLESLTSMEKSETLVLRNRLVTRVSGSTLVPGDILVLEEGEKIPADARIIESYGLRVNESILTGESALAAKSTAALPAEKPIGDRTNMVFKDTIVSSGRGKAVVTETGVNTEIGKIALYLTTAVAVQTPLTVELESVGRKLTFIIGIIALIIFLLNIYRHLPLIESVLISIALAVAAIPEGLPAIVTIVLSLGVKRLSLKGTIVKKLPSVETLGAIRIIATDKTGTLTQNILSVVNILLPDRPVLPIIGPSVPRLTPAIKAAVIRLLHAGILSSNAILPRLNDRPDLSKFNPKNIIGDMTEIALLSAAGNAGLNSETIREANPRVYEAPFTADRKMMSTIVKIGDTSDHFLYAKGAPEVILELCKLSVTQKRKYLRETHLLARTGLRSLALAQKKITVNELKNAIENDISPENNLEFLGIVGLSDPLRPEVKAAIASAKSAGIRTIMITGDHKATAAAIAMEAGITDSEDKTFTEEETSGLSQKELAEKIKKGASVFARISPMGKLRIIEAIKSIPGMQIAVTGDGVNDAPALQAAHIGIAMGQTGTDITREVADMVLTDDNYATIVDAIEEGRVIFANLVKFTRYLISCNLSEVLVVATGVFLGVPVILLPIQILWINLITDGLPALALGVDPPEKDIMTRPPRDLTRGILHAKRWIYMLVEGSIMGITAVSLFLITMATIDYKHAQTMAFATLAFSQLTHAFNNRSTRKSLFDIGFFGNKLLIAATFLSVTGQIFVIQTATGNTIFKTVALNGIQWLMVIMASLIPFLVVEIKKQLRIRILP